MEARVGEQRRERRRKFRGVSGLLGILSIHQPAPHVFATCSVPCVAEIAVNQAPLFQAADANVSGIVSAFVGVHYRQQDILQQRTLTRNTAIPNKNAFEHQFDYLDCNYNRVEDPRLLGQSSRLDNKSTFNR